MAATPPQPPPSGGSTPAAGGESSAAHDEKQARIVDARMRLRERFLEKMARTPGQADPKPLGTGPRNRHGMPQLPQGQFQTEKWPVLDLGIKPSISTAEWSLELTGAIEAPVTLRWADFLALPQTTSESDFHCVTTWSLMDSRWTGVQFSTLAALARPLPNAGFVFLHGSDGYTTNVPLEEALKDDVLLVHQRNGAPLPREHGGPVRMITPQLYAWKGAKWINKIEFLTQDRKGFWELRGYSNSAHPWQEDRYS